MKQIKYAILTIVLGLGLTSCGDSFLTQYPEGGVLLEDQYKSLPDKLEGAIKGIYSKLYEYGNHDTFGQRSMDMYADIQSGDMAMKKSSYGWFENYERGNYYAYTRSFAWSLYYEIIHLANLCDIAIEPNKTEIFAGMVSGDPEETIAQQGYYYGQVLALRGWAYAHLLNIYADPRDKDNANLDDKVLPIYTGAEVAADTLGCPLSTVKDVYSRIYEDLSEAVELLDFYGKLNQRGSKLEVDADVARLILAYAMLNRGDQSSIVADGKNCYQIALEQAQAVISGGKYPMLKLNELTTTGFCDVNASNWMWAEDVTVENTTALGSFFGQVDIHTYSYAAAGDTKGIDSNLYDEIAATGWDARKDWFRDGAGESPIGNGPKKSGFAYCPDGKFYCPKTKHTTDLSKVDRDWLCDNVFMRVELAYLIAAEAAYSNDDEATAWTYLDLLCAERIADGKSAEYSAWKAATSVENAIIYNWRVEMWGEGYSMQLFRRLQKTKTLGKNHLSRSNKTISVSADGELFQCQIPTSEVRYNPDLVTTGKTSLTHKN